jgi:hypothetical protein
MFQTKTKIQLEKQIVLHAQKVHISQSKIWRTWTDGIKSKSFKKEIHSS